MDLFSSTLKRPKLRPNRTVTEVDRDRTETETETWTKWCAKNWTGPGPPNPRLKSRFGGESKEKSPLEAGRDALDVFGD